MLVATAVDTVPVPSGDDLPGLEAYALRHHPALAVAAAEHQAATARVDQAGSLPDPVFMWGEMLEPVETRVGPQQRILSFQQPLPWPGTLAARGRSADALAAAAVASEQVTALRIVADVRRAWAQAAWLAETRLVMRRQAELLSSLEDAVRVAYEAGQARYADLLQIQVALARLEDRLQGLDDQRETARARLNAALGRDPAAALELPARLAPPPTDGDDGPRTPHPLLTLLDQRAAAARHEATAARRAGWPGFTLGLDWIQVGPARMDGVDGSGQDAVVARVGVSIPLWRGKHDGAADAAEARARVAQAERRAQDQQLAARITAATVAFHDAERRRQRYAADLIPRARQAYESVLAGYRADGSAFADVLGAQRTLLELEQARLDAERDLVLAAADLDEARGQLPITNRNEQRSQS
jgi:outer membrane protein TolC